MIFDVQFLNLELEAARTGAVPASLAAHPAFGAIACHETALDRPQLDESRFRSYFAAALNGVGDDWGLAPLFQQRDRLEEAVRWLEAEKDAISLNIQAWLGKFTSASPNPRLRCVLYVGTHDGGFQLGGDNNTIYLNLPAISCREGFLETLAHESYHAREWSPEAAQAVLQIDESDDCIGDVMYATFEEGIADFVGYDGATTTKYPVIRLRQPEEGTRELKDLLWRFRRGELSDEELYVAFRKTDCCYTAGVAIASAVWEKFGMAGLDIWSVNRDWKRFYKIFRETGLGADWPEI